MRKLKLFFACLLMAVLSIGQMWATEVTVSWSASTNALGSAISSEGGTANGTIATTYGTEISYSWNYTRTLVTLKSGKSDYIALSGSYMQCGSSNAGESVEFRTSNIPGTIKSVTVLLGSKDSRHTGSITVGGTDYNAGDIPAWANSAGDEWEGTGTSSGEIVISIDCNNKKSPIYIASITVVYEEGGSSTPTCATPTFNPAAGAVLSGTEVTISCATAGATIHYTTDGSDPTATSATSQPISVTSATTIKAIAVKEGSNNSAIATAAYTVVTPLTTMQDIFDAATTTETAKTITFNSAWVVSGVKSDGKQAYLTDGTKGLILYSSSNMGLAVGNTLSGTKECTLVLYNGAAELKNFSTTGLTKGTGGTVTPVVLNAAGINALSGVNTGSVIKISGECTNPSGSTYKIAGVQLFNQLFSYSAPTAGKNYNCTGVYLQYSSTKEILPRSAADIEEIIPTYTVTYNNTPSNGTLTIKNGDDVVASGSAVNKNTVLDILTSPAEGYTLDGVTVNGSAYTESTLTLTENVTIAATFKVNTAPLVTTYILSEIGTETSHLNGEHVGDKVNLPLTATTCSKTFVGWSANASCAVAPEYAPGAEITLAANNKLYAVYADANVVAPTDHALGSLTVGGTSGNTASEGYTYTSNKTNDKAGYTQDSGTKDADIIHLQIKAESQIINEVPSAIIVEAHLGAGSNKDPLDYPVYAVLVDADGANVGSAVVLTNAITDKDGEDFSASLPTANYANVRGVKISHMKEDGWNVRYYSMSFKYQTGGTTYSNYSTDCAPAPVTLVSVAISGTATELEYTEGDEFDPAGLAVTGTYSDASTAPITEGITWASTPSPLTFGTTSVSVTATVSEITSAAFVVNGLTVNALPPTTDNVVIIAEYDSKFYALTNSISNKTAAAIVVEKDGDKIVVPNAEAKTAIQWTKITNGANTTFQDANSKYLKGVDNGGDLTLADDACNWSWNTTGGYYCIGSRSFIYRESANGFKNYAATNAGSSDYSTIAEVRVIDPANIVITSKVSAELAYNPASDEITQGDSWSAPTLVNPHSVTITSYASDNESVATVEGGVIALAGGTGTANITAHFAGDASYLEGDAVYTITVNEAGDDLTGTWVLATAVPAVGERFIVAGTYNSVTKTMGSQNTNNRAAVASTLAEGVLTPGEGTKVFTLVDAGEGKFAIQASNGKYLSAAGTGTNNYLREAANYEAANAQWTISISEGIASVVASSSNRNDLQYNKSNPGLFSCYATDGQTPIQFYILKKYTVTYAAGEGGSGDAPTAVEPKVQGGTFEVAENTFTAPDGKVFDKWNDGTNDYAPGETYTVGTSNVVLTAYWKDAPTTPTSEDVRTGLQINRYYTICLGKDVTAATGATFWNLKNRNSAETEVYLEEVQLPLVAGKPYIFQATATTLNVTYGDETQATPINNGALRGTFEDLNATQLAAKAANVYILIQNSIRPAGGENSLKANRAYIDYDALTIGQPASAPGKRVRAIPMQPQVTTGMDELNASEKPVKLMIDGQLFILRGDKLYDATGRLVK